MRLPAILVLLALAGCSDAPVPAGTEPAPQDGRTAREAGAGNDLAFQLPPGPSSAALLVDVPEEAWQRWVVAGPPTEPYWRLQLFVHFGDEEAEEADAADEEAPADGPLGAALSLVAVGDVLQATSAPQQFSTAPVAGGRVFVGDYTSCAPGDRQYLIVVGTESEDAVNVTLSFGGGSEPQVVQPDAVAGGPVIAQYLLEGQDEVNRGWVLRDDRVEVPVYPSDAGSLGTDLDGPPGPGLFGMSAMLVSVAGAGEATVETRIDGAAASQSHPVASALGQSFVAAVGAYSDSLGLSLDLTGARAGVALDLRVAIAFPIDLAQLGLSLPTAQSSSHIASILVDMGIRPTACPLTA